MPLWLRLLRSFIIEENMHDVCIGYDGMIGWMHSQNLGWIDRLMEYRFYLGGGQEICSAFQILKWVR
jgi:hypothetical protein